MSEYLSPKDVFRGVFLGWIVISLANRELEGNKANEVIFDGTRFQNFELAQKRGLIQLACSSIEPAGYYEPEEVILGLFDGALSIKPRTDLLEQQKLTA